MHPIHLTADDYGLHPAVNRGIEDLAQKNHISGVSVMHHADASLNNPQALIDTGVSCGVHLVFVEERPLVPDQLSGLLDARGHLPKNYLTLARLLAQAPWRSRQLAAEARAQIEHHRALGLPLDFINSHQHVHLLPPLWLALRPLFRELDQVAIRVGHRLPLSPSADGAVALSSRLCWALAPLHNRVLLSPYGIAHAGRMTCGAARAILAAIAARAGERGEVRPEIVFHPGEEDADLRRRYSRWRYHWSREAKVAKRISGELEQWDLSLASRVSEAQTR